MNDNLVKMNIAVYIRVSTEDQAREGYSLVVQREYLEGFANREGYEVFKVYCDDGISAYSTRRPALQELLEDAKKNRIYTGMLVLIFSPRLISYFLNRRIFINVNKIKD